MMLGLPGMHQSLKDDLSDARNRDVAAAYIDNEENLGQIFIGSEN